MENTPTVASFWTSVLTALESARFVKLTLGKSRHRGQPQLKNIYARPLELRGEVVLQLTYRYADHDEVKNHPPAIAVQQLRTQLGGDFLSADLFTLDEQVSVQLSRKGKARIQRSAARHERPAMGSHNRTKTRLVEEDRPYLHALGITDAQGQVIPSGQKKYKQINKFIEIIDGLIRQHPLQPGARVVDMGSGKGYLTFALYDHLRRHFDDSVQVVGVELRPKLVEKCNNIAKDNNLSGLRFVEGYIDTFQFDRMDVLIALHACDTATDDALFSGLKAQAEIMVVAPCCQKQVRKDMSPPADLQPLLKSGILLERQASMLTDALRALYLEQEGYSTKVFEFISLEHTGKNVMITATKSQPRDGATEEIAVLKARFGIQRHHFEDLLSQG